MKIENYKFIEFGVETEQGKIYTKEDLLINSEATYLGYVSFEAAEREFLDAVAFSVEKVRVQDGWLVGDINVINGKATELLNWISEFTVSIVAFGSIEPITNKVINAELHSFVATPTARIVTT